ncbi:cholinephosphotransferase 1 isoform X5 [Hetaerina americana]|uniref:cholinephosphotransferase 1 isoform X5 n=1 Tax=Hetaerina americana TaxID=62018 RepID=UPI003A7F12E1
MFFGKGKLLSPGQLRRLGEHEYHCASDSLLDPWLNPWWSWLVTKVPLSVAPNTITIVGLAVNILTTLILIIYSPDAKAEAPRWAFFVCALGLFIYQSLDAIDGKQARRTGTSSPLGELFDHGCDSISTVFVAVSACISVQLGYYPTWMFFQCFCAMALFYCAHWQTYVSGKLRFGKVDVTEAQITIIFIHLISAVFGSSIWSTKIPYLMVEIKLPMAVFTFMCAGMAFYNGFNVIINGGVGKNGSTVAIPLTTVHLSQAVCAVFFIGYAHIFLTFCQTIHTGGVGKNGSTVALPFFDVEMKLIPMFVALLVAILLAQANIVVIFTGGVGKNGSTVAGTSVLSPVIPFGLVIVPAYIIYKKSIDGVYENNPVLYILAFGLVTSKVTNRLVVAHMTKNEMEYLDSALLGPSMLFLNQYFNFYIAEYNVLWLCLIWTVIDLLKYSSQVCLEICDHLKIDLFKMPGNLNVRSATRAYSSQTSSSSFSSPGSATSHKNAEELTNEDSVPLLEGDWDETHNVEQGKSDLQNVSLIDS